MNHNRFKTLVVCAVVALLAVGGMSGTVAATEEEDCGVDGCLDDPDNGQPEVVPGGGVAFDTPVVEETGVMPGDRVSIDGEFTTFLKAKKAFHEGRQSLQAIQKGQEDPEDVPTFFDEGEGDE